MGLAEFIKQYGQTIISYLMYILLIGIILGGTVMGTKGLLYITGANADKKEFIGEDQTDESGEVIGKSKNDIEYITDENGETIPVVDTDNFNKNLQDEFSQYSNLKINIRDELTSNNIYSVSCYGNNNMFFGEVTRNGNNLKLSNISDDTQIKSRIKLNSIKKDNSNNLIDNRYSDNDGNKYVIYNSGDINTPATIEFLEPGLYLLNIYVYIDSAYIQQNFSIYINSQH